MNRMLNGFRRRFLAGLVVVVPARDVLFLDMPVEDGLELIISVGITAPEDLVQREG